MKPKTIFMLAGLAFLAWYFIRKAQGSVPAAAQLTPSAGDTSAQPSGSLIH